MVEAPVTGHVRDTCLVSSAKKQGEPGCRSTSEIYVAVEAKILKNIHTLILPE